MLLEGTHFLVLDLLSKVALHLLLFMKTCGLRLIADDLGLEGLDARAEQGVVELEGGPVILLFVWF